MAENVIHFSHAAIATEHSYQEGRNSLCWNLNEKVVYMQQKLFFKVYSLSATTAV